MTALASSYADLALAAVLVLLNGALSLALGLGLGRRLALAAVRTAVQIAAVGLVLTLVFAQASAAWTLGIALLFALAAGYEVFRRQDRRISGSWWTYGLGSAALVLAGTVATLCAAAGMARSGPWYAPRELIPILCVVLGTTLTSVALALQLLSEGAERQRGAIEAHIALGATRFAAFRPVMRSAMTAAMTPLFGLMSLAGFVLMPGFMAGQIFAGANPADAARYEIMVMVLAVGSAGLGAFGAVVGGVLLLTDRRHRLRLDRLSAQTP